MHATNKKESTMKVFSFKPLAHALLIASMSGLLSTAAVAQDKKEADPREFNYLQLAGGLAMSSSANIKVGLGNGVLLPGQAQYDQGSLWGITLGRQFLREEDEQKKAQRAAATGSDKTQEPEPMRVELEFWSASTTRNTIHLAAQIVHPMDKIKPTAVFLNMAVPISQSDELYKPEDPQRKPEPLWRTWLGAGIGYGTVSYPSASAISGCNCLREASGNGLAYQLNLKAERQIGDNTYLIGQIGRVWLPSVSTTQGGLKTAYERWGVNSLLVGLRWSFRN